MIKKYALGAIAALLGLWVAYLVLANGLLWSGLVTKLLSQDPQKARFACSSAYSLWPGSIHATDFVFRGSDSILQWSITADRANAHIAPFAIFSKHMHITHASARGVSVRIRLKVEPEHAREPWVANLPPIDGFSDPPIKGAKVPDVPDSEYPYFTIDVEDTSGEDVREVWVNTVRLADHGSIHGGFFLKPNRLTFVRPTDAHPSDAMISEGDALVADHLSGTIDFEMDGFDPRKASGFDIVHGASARVKLAGQTRDLGFLNSHVKEVALRGGEGPINADIVLDHGILKPRTRIEWRADGWSVIAGDHHATGSSLIHATARSAVWISLDSRSIVWSHRGQKIITAPNVETLFRLESTDLGRDPQLAASIDVSDARLELAAIDALTGKPIFRAGEASVGFHADGSPSFVQARASVASTKVNANFTATARPGPLQAIIAMNARTVDGTPIWRAAGLPKIASNALESPGGLLDIEGIVRVPDPKGAFLLKRAGVTAGVEIDGSKTSVRPLASREWFRGAASRVK